MDSSTITQQIRSFNRFYTRNLGLLNHHFLNSPLSLPESRVLYELAQDDTLLAKDLVRNLQIDKGYLSRVLKRFEKKNWIVRANAQEDKRMMQIQLTEEGRELFQYLNDQSEQQILSMLHSIGEHEQLKLVHALAVSEKILTQNQSVEKSVSLKDIRIRTKLKPGDLSFVIQAHAQLYQEEFSYGIAFEVYVAQAIMEYYEQYTPDNNRVWICEYLGERIGFLALMNRGDWAQLRFFFIDAQYRGIGLGNELMKRYMKFLKSCGYKSSYLWTTDEQQTAAGLYQKHGFKLVEEKESAVFGKPLKELKYELIL